MSDLESELPTDSEKYRLILGSPLLSLLYDILSEESYQYGKLTFGMIPVGELTMRVVRVQSRSLCRKLRQRGGTTLFTRITWYVLRSTL